MIDAIEINDADALPAYARQWRELLRGTPRGSFFQSIEWLQAYARRAGDRERLRVVLVRSGGRLVGVAPMVERTERTAVGPIRVLTYPLDEWGVWYGPVGPNPSATLMVAMRLLSRGPRTWDVLAPCWVAHDGVDGGRTEHAMRLAGLAPHAAPHATTSVLRLDRFVGWDDYLARRPRKFRHEVQRKARQLERSARVEHVRWRPEPGGADDRMDLYEECVELSRRSWQAGSDTGNTLCDPEVAGLLCEAHRGAARLGMVDLNLLRLDGRPAAFYYGYRSGGELLGLRTGYDARAASGAGAVLFARMVEDSFARGDTRLDLGPGPEAYKRRWRTATETSWRLSHARPGGWRGRALAAARRWRRSRRAA
ncbi:GNAT family N-acetyltransferase [Botrimarina sp.]|uniref:GNAT family N-acetyltransferase n=1 Tax=Botrimarina sp. TaxID=2795802 RepID=UPI0032ECCEC8